MFLWKASSLYLVLIGYKWISFDPTLLLVCYACLWTASLLFVWARYLWTLPLLVSLLINMEVDVWVAYTFISLYLVRLLAWTVLLWTAPHLVRLLVWAGYGWTPLYLARLLVCAVYLWTAPCLTRLLVWAGYGWTPLHLVRLLINKGAGDWTEHNWMLVVDTPPQLLVQQLTYKNPYSRSWRYRGT